MVVKYGGNAMKTLELRQAVAQEIATLRQTRPIVVVHGGGPVIETNLNAMGVPSHFHRGLRVTTPEVMAVVEPALTLLGKQLAQDITGAIGLTGRDAQILFGETLDENTYGLVGQVTRVNAAALRALITVGFTPVLASLAVDHQGRTLNVNADTAAGAVAGALHWPVIYLTDVPGVLTDPKDPTTLRAALTRQEAQDLIQNGTITGGMIPKVESALHALTQGAPSAIIASGMAPGILEQAARGHAGTTLLP
ncbi:MAG TPA: acetylglutamate kinase [Deinococcales bacterium]|nr:acetylglutamate kinase [Deinococcales bacterium]